ncbi:MAG TPA: hypothetical protein VG937_37735 [Polyangiaceae bacterium]|nr:hypothetical protein [Polyangiaceae bacterium]
MQGGSATTGGSNHEFCEYHFFRCMDGEVWFSGPFCADRSATCMLGCRTDGFQHPESARSELDAPAYALQLCEEYRLANGPRRPGDPCQTDIDCRPYPSNQQPTGTAWPTALHCLAGLCRDDSGGGAGGSNDSAGAGGGGAGGSNDSAGAGGAGAGGSSDPAVSGAGGQGGAGG